MKKEDCVMINLINGSVFDSKCDLIILPCDDEGGVTPWVYREIDVHNLPQVKKSQAGEIWFSEITGGYPNASIIGYAASVSSIGRIVTSSKAIVSSIAKSIKSYCEVNYVNIVNMPLLGTGAGGLSPQDSFDEIKSVFENEQNLTVNIYVLNNKSYNLLKKSFVDNHIHAIKSPRVFLSYTGTDRENGRWVKNLADKLRASGVDARIDVYNLKPGFDLPQWMTNELIMADKVLLICDKYYAEKADVRKGGVGWETMIIQGDMLTHQDQNKYIALVRDEDIDHSLPIYMKSKYSLVWSDEKIDDNGFMELMKYLFDCEIAPPIGKIPDYIVASKTQK